MNLTIILPSQNQVILRGEQQLLTVNLNVKFLFHERELVKQQKLPEMKLLLTSQKNVAVDYFVVYSQVEKEEQKRDAKREELNLVERPNVEERVAAEQNAVEEKDNLKKRTIII